MIQLRCYYVVVFELSEMDFPIVHHSTVHNATTDDRLALVSYMQDDGGGNFAIFFLSTLNSILFLVPTYPRALSTIAVVVKWIDYCSMLFDSDFWPPHSGYDGSGLRR